MSVVVRWTRILTSAREGGQAIVMLDVGLLGLLAVGVIVAHIAFPPIDAFLPVVAPDSLGIQGGWALDDQGNVDFPGSLRSNLSLIRQVGASSIRINFRLGAHYADWTTRDARGLSALDQYDVVVNEIREKYGLHVLGLISNESWRGGQGDWTANSAEYAGGNGDNAYLAALSKRAAAVLIQHFQGRIGDWEVWNEPNGNTTTVSGQPRGGTYIYPSNFAQLLRHIYEDARQSPGMRIISGGLLAGDWDLPPGVPTKSDALRRDSGAAYLAATYQQGRRVAGWDSVRAKYGAYPLDAVGLHLYVDPGGKTTRRKVEVYLQEVRDAYATYEASGTSKRVVVTEFGWGTDAVTQEIQAANLQIAYAAFRDTSFVENGYWFFVQDNAAAGLFYGLQTMGPGGNGGSSKLSLGAYKEASAYHPGITVFGLQILRPSPLHFADQAGR